jgi:molybdopterin molybdotransferase
MSLMPVSEVRARILRGAEPLGSEHVSIYEAAGRVLSQPLTAARPQPPFSAAAMDGYAVRATDIATVPATLKQIGLSAAGHGFDGVVGPGEAVRIFTGAPFPQGADTIVIQENTKQRPDGLVEVLEGAIAGRNLRPLGYDFKEGERLLSAGTRLYARHLMLAAAMNCAAVPVYRKPLVAMLANGDELVLPGGKPGRDQIVSSIPAALTPAIKAWGGEPMLLDIAKDNRASLSAGIEAGAKADILLTIGGASVGDHDLVKSTLEEAGARFDVLKAAIRPGKPIMFGRRERQLVLSLPGNPVSAMVCAVVFLKPLIETLIGLSGADTVMQAPLAEPLEANGEREHYVRARHVLGGVAALPDQDSSLSSVFAMADCLIVRPSHSPALAAGALVPTVPLTF